MDCVHRPRRMPRPDSLRAAFLWTVGGAALLDPRRGSFAISMGLVQAANSRRRLLTPLVVPPSGGSAIRHMVACREQPSRLTLEQAGAGQDVDRRRGCAVG